MIKDAMTAARWIGWSSSLYPAQVARLDVNKPHDLKEFIDENQRRLELTQMNGLKEQAELFSDRVQQALTIKRLDDERWYVIQNVRADQEYEWVVRTKHPFPKWYRRWSVYHSFDVEEYYDELPEQVISKMNALRRLKFFEEIQVWELRNSEFETESRYLVGIVGDFRVLICFWEVVKGNNPLRVTDAFNHLPK